MYNIGDIVKMDLKSILEYTHGIIPAYYTEESFVIMGHINEKIVRLNKTLNNLYKNNEIHVDFLKLYIKEMRKQKLEKLGCTSLIGDADCALHIINSEE